MIVIKIICVQYMNWMLLNLTFDVLRLFPYWYFEEKWMKENHDFKCHNRRSLTLSIWVFYLTEPQPTDSFILLYLRLLLQSLSNDVLVIIISYYFICYFKIFYVFIPSLHFSFLFRYLLYKNNISQIRYVSKT